MMKSAKEQKFDELVQTKFNVYNGLFLNLPYKTTSNTGTLIPLLTKESEVGLINGENPTNILNNFFQNHTELKTEQERIDFMFNVIQYVERQVVLFDSVEDAAFQAMKEGENMVSLAGYIQKAKEVDEVNLENWLKEFSTRIVFTAHPTQFYTPAVLDIIAQLRLLIAKNEINLIDVTLQQLGLTSLINRQKPTPLDEAKNIIYYLRNVYYKAIGEFYTELKSIVNIPEFENYDIVKLGFWPGGDRDGNPFVTAKVTQDVANELRLNLMKCYYGDVKALQQKLTFPGIDQLLVQLKDQLYASMFNKDVVLSFAQIMTPLLQAKNILETNFNSLYLLELESLIQKVNIFKTHFASLDIRQDHSVHKGIVETVLRQKGAIKNTVLELSTEQLRTVLLESKWNLEDVIFEDGTYADTVENVRQLRQIQLKNGEEGCNRYIISNATDEFAVLYVLAIFRWCSWNLESLTFDIVPLFETMEGMETAQDTMLNLFSNPRYVNHLKKRGQRQTIMLGFSDGTKDGGYFKANWSIYKTKETLTQLCESKGIKALFFDGRGGPPSRGGGKTHRFYAAQSDSIANYEIQLTIQGQTITSNYGTAYQFKYNSERLVSAGLSKRINPNKNQIAFEQRELLESLSEESYKKYILLKNHKHFIPYLEHRSTLKYYGKANIGSRPGKRGVAKELTLSDLRAISFVGSWSQLKQNVPGYFGAGTAIKAMVDKGKLTELQTLFANVPLFKALCLNSMMSLCKCNFNLTAYMKTDKVYGEFWQILYDEYKLSIEMLLLVSRYSELMEEEPISKKSIAIRERIVLPLLVIQQHALQQITKQGVLGNSYEKMVTRSLYGNINASRNSA